MFAIQLENVSLAVCKRGKENGEFLPQPEGHRQQCQRHGRGDAGETEPSETPEVMLVRVLVLLLVPPAITLRYPADLWLIQHSRLRYHSLSVGGSYIFNMQRGN